MAITIGIVLISGLRILSPSTAAATEIGGVIIPSASSAAPPMMAGQINLGFLLLNKAKSEKIPPSPSLQRAAMMAVYGRRAMEDMQTDLVIFQEAGQPVQ